jgi:hypothetical protein
VENHNSGSAVKPSRFDHEKPILDSPPVPEGPWRWLVPVLLVLLFLLVLLWLPWQARQMESNERQEQLIADTLWVEQTLRFELARSEEALATLGADLAVARRRRPHAAGAPGADVQERPRSCAACSGSMPTAGCWRCAAPTCRPPA